MARLETIRRKSPPKLCLVPLTSTLAAAVCCGSGLLLLTLFTRGHGGTIRLAAALILLASGICQAAFVAAHRAAKTPPSISQAHRRLRVLGRVMLGALVAYLAAMGCPSPSDARELGAAAWAAWLAIELLPSLALKRGSALIRVASKPSVRRLEACAIVGGLLIVGSELALQLTDVYAGRPLTRTVTLGHLKRSYQTPQFAERAAGNVRVAVIGAQVLGTTESSADWLSMLAQQLDGIELRDFSVSRATPCHYASHFESDIAPAAPDLLLAFLSIGHDFAALEASPAPSDWRRLWLVELGQMFCASQAWGAEMVPTVSMQPDYDAYLRITSRRLMVCRTPIEPTVEQQWQRSVADVERLGRACRERGVPLALILVPADFQVSDRLRDAAVKRTGIEARKFDLNLPQRRLAGLAQRLDATLVDLTPHLRAAGTSAFARHCSELNDHGQAVASRVVGAWLERRYASLLAAATPIELR